MKMPERQAAAVEHSPLLPVPLNGIHPDAEDEMPRRLGPDTKSVTPHHLAILRRRVGRVDERRVAARLKINNGCYRNGHREHGRGGAAEERPAADRRTVRLGNAAGAAQQDQAWSGGVVLSSTFT